MPVNLEFGSDGVYGDLGSEDHDGKRVVVFAADDGIGNVHLALSPAEATDRRLVNEQVSD